VKRNPQIPYTYQYSQPDEYHFSIDSIEMPWQIAQYLKNNAVENLQSWHVLDLCAGCGVIGFELNFHIPALQKIDYLEVQSVYIPHFERNKSLVSNYGDFQFLNLNYEKILTEEFHQKYDLILCNPPYFQLGLGKLSPSEFKNRCRFFIDSTFEKLLEVIQHTMKTSGEAFLLLRPLEEHGLNLLAELKKLSGYQLECETVSDIRGTLLLKLHARD
jgi:tRNA1(Val) A37 N6-methylase TrmN6